MTFDSDRDMLAFLDLIPPDIADALVCEALQRNSEFASWYVAEAAARESFAEREETEQIAKLCGARLTARIRTEQVSARVREMPRVVRPAPIIGTAAQVQQHATDRGAGLVVDLPVAAGAGRELWDEVSDTWVDVPAELPRGDYLAFPVRGDSMAPFLRSRDEVLVRLGNEAVPGTVVVARTNDDGYVVKYVEAIDEEILQLASLNPDYAGVQVAAEPSAVIGTVVARFRREN